MRCSWRFGDAFLLFKDEVEGTGVDDCGAGCGGEAFNVGLPFDFFRVSRLLLLMLLLFAGLSSVFLLFPSSLLKVSFLAELLLGDMVFIFFPRVVLSETIVVEVEGDGW